MNYTNNDNQEEVVLASNNSNESTKSGKKNLENLKSFLLGEKEKNEFLQESHTLAKETNLLKNDTVELFEVTNKKTVTETQRSLEGKTSSGIEDVEPYPEPVDLNKLLLEIDRLMWFN